MYMQRDRLAPRPPFVDALLAAVIAAECHGDPT